jgi:23S rRNA pseudouridine2605 synthase
MAKKVKIPKKYKSSVRRSRNERFQEGHRSKNNENTEKKEHSLKKEHIIYKKNPPDKMRLNKYISNSGVCSRREADNLIKKGDIKVNGKTITEVGTIVSPTDVIEYQGEKLNPEKKVYLLLNKPKDTVTTARDP